MTDWTNTKFDNTAVLGADASNPDSLAPRIQRSRIIFFVTVVLSILLAANWFVGATWNHFLGTTAVPAWEIIPPA